jgi:hypothetical protein
MSSLTASRVMLAAARLRYVAGTKWGKGRYIDMEELRDQDKEEAKEVAA